MSFLGDLLDFLKKLVQNILSDLSAGGTDILVAAETIIAAKEIAKEEFAKLHADVEAVFKRADEFKSNVLHLRSKVVRADKAFEFVHSVFSGELRTFCTEGLGEIRTVILDTMQEVITAGQSVGAIKSTTQSGIPGAIQKIIAGMKTIFIAWKTTTQIIKTLQRIVPVLEEFLKKMEDFEKIIMSQKSKPRYISARFRYHSRRPEGAAGGLEADASGTQDRLNAARRTIRDLEEGIRILAGDEAAEND